ncbi:hypothetical protein GE061_019732 [Apolygus lucorum]|uniref:Uncharacterized protein n=1 Tax=Apolygus lucorum TaxID=248454 RepID=A0A8S9XAG3_APOLU|nr:hypothetical protein GE061_019732 [Apolygus lucorum]
MVMDKDAPVVVASGYRCRPKDAKVLATNSHQGFLHIILMVLLLVVIISVVDTLVFLILLVFLSLVFKVLLVVIISVVDTLVFLIFNSLVITLVFLICLLLLGFLHIIIHLQVVFSKWCASNKTTPQGIPVTRITVTTVVEDQHNHRSRLLHVKLGALERNVDLDALTVDLVKDIHGQTLAVAQKMALDAQQEVLEALTSVPVEVAVKVEVAAAEVEADNV